ncbi:queuine tRNA-ribosyltransferase accessory subunit 2 [Plakobranchus ocellatus]|uniref:Queuine tRNA-ribosyltransferase accessory subunit 2 n=1 Tax=Plakobranchus ocellatus TaxID=259542 RepID=A0AAV3Y5S4_9GAST|nr:queuine tRNA-ribosyltransferase accessory subunit 2 [Plakobranchus ocellatus]
MKFSVEKVVGGGRLGTILPSGPHGSTALETPMCTLYTRGGSAPHLGVDMLKRVSNVPDIAAMSLGSLAPHHENIRDFGKGIGEFAALKSSLIFTTLHDASAAVTSGKNDRNGVAVWGKGGKFKMDPSLFVKVQEALRPDWFQALSDGDTDKHTAKKRLAKAVNNTLDFLDGILELTKNNKILKDASLIGAIEGGFDEEERKRSAKETAARPVHGFLIEGFEKGHSGVDLFSIDSFTKLLEKTVSFLPEDKPRIMETVWSPLQIVKAFNLGIDVFSSSYPYLLTERGQALVADYTIPSSSPAARLENKGSPNGALSTTSGFYVNLKDKCYFEDFSPVLTECDCYCCATFTRSYIHHLLNTSELLAYVLLMIHNFHQYFHFFNCLRRSAREGTLEDLQASLEAQMNSKPSSET